MSNEIQILTEFKNGIVSFLDELIEQFPEEPDLVIARIFLNDQIPIVDIMNHFIHKLLPLEQEVKEKNERFFLENNLLFDKVDNSRVNNFKRLWNSGRLDKEDKNTIWKWYESFIYLAKKYQKLKFGV